MSNLIPSNRVLVNGAAPPSYYYAFQMANGNIVFHLGGCGDLSGASATAVPYDLGAHHVTVLAADGVTKLVDQDVAAHYWNSEWTFRGMPVILLVKTAAQIVAANRMFPLAQGNGPAINPVPACSFAGPMDASTIMKYFPTTGERADIGLITDNSANFMLGNGAGDMLAWAQAANSVPNKVRDESTGKLINLATYPSANMYDAPGYQGAPWIPKGLKDPTSGYTVFSNGWNPQQAHYPELSYVAYMATQDDVFLTDLQYSANFTIFCDASYSGPSVGARIAYAETRGMAWALRNLFMAHIATQDAEARGALPDVCQPSSYFKQLLDNSLPFWKTWLTDPGLQLFRIIGPNKAFAQWQMDYLVSALGFGVLTGHSDWTPVYLWALGHQIARADPKSGYLVGYGTPYGLYTLPVADQSKYPSDLPNVIPASERFATWGDALHSLIGDPTNPLLTQALFDQLTADPLNGGKAVVGMADYNMYLRMDLIQAAYLDNLGLAGVRAMYPQLDSCITNVNAMVVNSGFGMTARHALVSSTQPTQPANGGTINPMNFTLAVGASVNLQFTPNGDLAPGNIPTWTPANASVALTPSADGLTCGVKRVASGICDITVAATGATPFTVVAECDDPLATGGAITVMASSQ